MNRSKPSRIGRMIAAITATGLAGVASAQQDFSDVQIVTTDLGSGIAMLEGRGGNIAVSTGPDGVLLVDDQFAPLTDKIRAAVAKQSSAPIRFLLNTHWHGDHAGGNENFGRAGVLILAHDNVRERLSRDQYMAAQGRHVPAAPESAWPVVTYEDGVTLHLNGQTIQVVHVAPAHTDGDSLVRFIEADVIHTGDTFFAGRYPFIDLSSGGRIDGMIDAQARALALASADTRIIPGHGPVVGRAALRANREMLLSVRARVRKMVERGLDRRAVLRARPSREFDPEFGGGFMSPDRFVGLVYDSLVADRYPEGDP